MLALWLQYLLQSLEIAMQLLETAIYPKPALWIDYLLNSLEIAVYPTVQVTVVRNSYIS